MRAALAGIYDPHASFDEAAARSRVGAADGAVLADGPLAAAGPGPLGRSGAVRCLIDGRVANVHALEAELGLPPGGREPDVVAAAFVRLGPSVLERLRGEFALLVWDGHRRTGLVAQDQVGPMTVFLCEQGGRLAFASEVGSLLRLLPTRPAPNERALAHWIANDALPAGATLYAGVERLGGGTALEFDVRERRRLHYWAPRYEPPVRRARTEAVEQVREALTRAVRTRTDGPEPVAILMSGGVDSSVVAAVAATSIDDAAERVCGYSAVFPGDDRIDESASIDALTQRLGLPSVQLHARRQGVLAVTLDYLRAWELPPPGPGYVLERPLLGLAAEAGAGVVLDGQGGDELFGHAPYLLADRLARGRFVSAVQLARRFPTRDGSAVSWQKAFRIFRKYGVRAALPHRLRAAVRAARGRRSIAPDWVAPGPAAILLESSGADPWSGDRDGAPRWWAFLLHLLTAVREDYGLHEYVRHRAAAVGMVARPPLLDVDLVELMLRMPPELQFSPANRPLARAAVRELVPERVFTRTKSNLTPYYYETLAGPDLAGVRRLLGEGSEVARYTRPDVVRRWLDRPESAEPALWLTAVWSLVTAECWLRHQTDPTFAERMALDVPPPSWDVRPSVVPQRSAAG